MTVSCPPELRRLYQQGRIIPFVGAGASMAVSWKQDGQPKTGPSWHQLVNQAAHILGVEDPELLRMRGTDLQILEYLRGRFDTVQPLINWLHTNMQPDDAAIASSKLHTVMAGLDSCHTFYTTNYDNFIERALRLRGRAVTAIASEHDLSSTPTESQVVKFHGDFDRPETMVLSERDYERRMRLEDVLDLKLRADVLGRALLFIGYSFRDANVAYLFRLVTDHFASLPQSFAGKRAYIIYPNPSKFELLLFNSRQMEVVPVSTHKEVADILKLMSE